MAWQDPHNFNGRISYAQATVMGLISILRQYGLKITVKGGNLPLTQHNKSPSKQPQRATHFTIRTSVFLTQKLKLPHLAPRYRNKESKPYISPIAITAMWGPRALGSCLRNQDTRTKVPRQLLDRSTLLAPSKASNKRRLTNILERVELHANLRNSSDYNHLVRHNYERHKSHAQEYRI